MISILVVEDEAEKRRLMSEVLLKVSGVEQSSLKFAADVVDAKRQLAGSGFDLLLLDMNLPKRADRHAEIDGGVELLRWLKGRGKNHRPRYIIGTSVYAEALDFARTDFDNLLWSLIAIDYSSSGWRNHLTNSVLLILDDIVPPFSSDGVTYRSDVLVVTALPDPELNAILELPISWNSVDVRHDSASYRRGELGVEGGKLDIVVTASSDKGLTSAAIAVTKGIYAFRPRYVIMCGICAGLEGKTSLGDVVVADACWDWGSGKIRVSDGVEIFHPAPYQQRLDETLKSTFVRLRDTGELEVDLMSSLPLGKLWHAPTIHIGPVATGASVLQSSQAMMRVLAQHKDLLALEMEIYAVFLACSMAPAPRPLPIALKGVCDFGNEEKADGYQKLAAIASARVLYNFLRLGVRPS